MTKKKIICIDIDNTLCVTHRSDYKKSKPKKKKIIFVNSLYDRGHKIILYTARFMGRNKNNLKLAHKQGYVFTKAELKKWGVKYHKLFMGKPSADIYIDDKFLGFKNNWDVVLKKLLF